jgi:hypothetical protein
MPSIARSARPIVLAAAAVSLAVAPAADAHASKVKLAGGATTLKLSSDTAGALQSLGIAAAPIAPAGAARGGLAFPVTSGRVDAKTLAGKIRHSGGIRLSRGSTAVDLKSFTIRIDKHPDLTAKVGDSRVSILRLDLSDAKVAIKGRKVKVANVGATLTKAAADALNAAFSTSAFAKGLDVGTATVRTRIAH